VKIQLSQDDPLVARELDAIEDGWDLIVDDASHDGKLTAAALENLWPVVAPGGYYVIEDWFVGFSCYDGYDDSMLALAKSLVERLDPWYGPEKYTDVESVEFRHGMAILRKRALCPSSPALRRSCCTPCPPPAARSPAPCPPAAPPSC
jgi:hypothetical protein